MRVAGADGCKAGWVVAWRDSARPDAVELEVCADFASLCGRLGEGILAIDMPIGLPDRVGRGGRAPEIALRPLLGQRQSSVFAMPGRAAIDGTDYDSCCRVAQTCSDPPRKVSKQAFHLFPRVREIDTVLRANAGLAARVFECHPEAAFRTMRGAPLLLPKKVKSAVHPPGLAERRALLAAESYPDRVLDAPLPRGLGRDDWLDALAASWTAARIAAGCAICFPAEPERDRYGLEVAIRA